MKQFNKNEINKIIIALFHLLILGLIINIAIEGKNSYFNVNVNKNINKNNKKNVKTFNKTWFHVLLIIGLTGFIYNFYKLVILVFFN
jgi:hypothetical protein